MTKLSLTTALAGFTALAFGVLASGATFAQSTPGGVPTTTNGQAPPPGTLPPTFSGGGGWGVPRPNPDGSAEQPFVQTNADGTEEITWVHIPAPPPPPPPAPEGFADPNVTMISIGPNGDVTYYHYKDGSIIGKNRDGKVVVAIAPVAVAQAAVPAPPPAPPKQAAPNPGDRPVGGGMYERAGTGTGVNPGDRPVGGGMYERAGTGKASPLEGFIDVPPKKSSQGPKIHLGDEPPQIGMAIPHAKNHEASTRLSTLEVKKSTTEVHQTASAAVKSLSLNAPASRAIAVAAVKAPAKPVVETKPVEKFAAVPAAAPRTFATSSLATAPRLSIATTTGPIRIVQH